MSEDDVKLDKEAQERHEKAMQWLRQHYIEAYEKYQHLFPEAEAELKQFELKQAELLRSQQKAPPQPRRPAAKRVRTRAKNLAR